MGGESEMSGDVVIRSTSGNTVHHTVNNNIHIHIHADDPSALERLKEMVSGLFNGRPGTIEGAAQILGTELQGCEDRQLGRGFNECSTGQSHRGVKGG